MTCSMASSTALSRGTGVTTIRSPSVVTSRKVWDVMPRRSPVPFPTVVAACSSAERVAMSPIVRTMLFRNAISPATHRGDETNTASADSACAHARRKADVGAA
jgi:hypothetical protein